MSTDPVSPCPVLNTYPIRGVTTADFAQFLGAVFNIKAEYILGPLVTYIGNHCGGYLRMEVKPDAQPDTFDQMKEKVLQLVNRAANAYAIHDIVDSLCAAHLMEPGTYMVSE